MCSRSTGSRAILMIGAALCLGPWPDLVQAAEESSQLSEIEYRLVSPGTQPLKLAHGFCDPASFVVQVEGMVWRQGEDYRVRARSGVVVPLRPWSRDPGQESAESDNGDKTKALVVIQYRFLPVPVVARQDLRPVGKGPLGTAEPGDASASDTDDGPYFSPTGTGSPWQDGNLQVSGSKTVQVSSGNRREMTVDQNLRLNIVGQLTNEISVRAFLSDDNLPVVPEGNTEELRDIDKVLVEMAAPNWKATLGDFVARRTGSTFGNYRRKLQGFSLQATPGPAMAEVLAGSPRGLYRTLQIRGQESNQGPYYLGGGQGGDNLFIVAGSERVSLDGAVLVRGQDRDYTIDYVRGTVTFTYRRLITAESTIVVEFEEGEGPYGRTVVGAGGGVNFTIPGLGLPAIFSARVVREKDDPGRLRTGELGDEDESILAAAGDDPFLAVASGISPRDPGEGQYDQGLSGEVTIYIFNPSGGDFDVSFFYVGPAQGDYTLDSLTENGQKVFAYQGPGLGNYRIGRPLPMPSSQSVATLNAAVGDTAGDYIRAEWDFGNTDQNLLSDLDNEDNNATAGRLEALMRSRNLTAWGKYLGRASLRAFWEKQEADFKPFQVHKTVFDYDEWGLADRARQEGFLEQSDSEAGVNGIWQIGGPGQSLEVSGNLGSLRHGEDLKADRLAGGLRWNLAGGQGRHSIQTAHSQDLDDPLDARHNSQNHRVNWLLGPVIPGATYNYRKWDDSQITGARAAGFRLEELGVNLASAPGKTLDWRVDFTRGLADSLVNNDWVLQRDSRTFSTGVNSGRFAGMRLVGEGTLREILSPGAPEQTTRLARLNFSGDWKRTLSNWSLGYRVDNSRTEVLDRQVIFVGENQGDFNQDGDFVGRGQGDYNMVLVGTDSLVATTGVVADLNWRQGFAFLGSERWYGAWNALTLASIEGRSTTQDIGQLLALDPSVLFNDASTVLGDFHFSEELALLQHRKTEDLRVKFDFVQTMDRQFADHPEDRISRNWQVNGNLNLSRKSSLRLRWNRQDESRYSTESSASARRSYDSLTHRYEVGWNYRPANDLRIGIQGEFITRADAVSQVSQDEYALRPSARQRFMRQWTLQADVRLAEVASNEPPGSQRPWFYSYPGRNFDSTLRLAWEPSQFLSVSASWFTRKQGDRRWQHDLRLESTARF